MLLVSSEVPEVLGLADRVLVMREGRVVREAPAGELDEDTVLDLVMAGSLMEGAAGMSDRRDARADGRTGAAPPAEPAEARRRDAAGAGWWRDDGGEPVRRNLGLVGGAGRAGRRSASSPGPTSTATRTGSGTTSSPS